MSNRMDPRCPRGLIDLPCQACPKALEAIKNLRDGKPIGGGCPWYVADAGSSYCWFKMMADNGNKPIPPARIAQLEMIPDSEVKLIEARMRASQALRELADDE